MSFLKLLMNISGYHKKNHHEEFPQPEFCFIINAGDYANCKGEPKRLLTEPPQDQPDINNGCNHGS